MWKRNYVRSVQVTFAESIGVEGRGSFYDSVGALRDVVQNHLLQVVALLAMEPPVGPEANFLQDEKAKVFAATESICCSDVVRGQYVGYLDEPGVAPGSTTETFVAARLEIDSWRWAGVPFYIRRQGAGPRRHRGGRRVRTAAAAAVRRGRRSGSTATSCASGSGNDGVTFTLQAKTPGEHGQRGRQPHGRLRGRWASDGTPTSGCWGTRWPATLAASPARTSSSGRGGSSSRPSTTPVPSSLRAGVVGAAGGGRASCRGLVPAELSRRRAARRLERGPGRRGTPTTTATPTPRARPR